MHIFTQIEWKVLIIIKLKTNGLHRDNHPQASGFASQLTQKFFGYENKNEKTTYGEPKALLLFNRII